MPLHNVKQPAPNRPPSSGNRDPPQTFIFPDEDLQATSAAEIILPSLLFRTPGRSNGGARRDRTDDIVLAKHALSQLSYGPDHRTIGPAGSREPAMARRRLVGLGRLELPTSRLSSARSNQLSYKPKAKSVRRKTPLARAHTPQNGLPRHHTASPWRRRAANSSVKKEKRRRRSPAKRARRLLCSKCFETNQLAPANKETSLERR